METDPKLIELIAKIWSTLNGAYIIMNVHF